MNHLVGRAVVTALVLTSLGAVAPTQAAATAPPRIAQHVAIPTYVYPTFDDWNRVKAAGNGVNLVVANVANGPGDGGALNDLWRDNVINPVSATGTRVLGYVDTGYLGAPTSSGQHATIAGETTVSAWVVQAMQQVERWYAFYGSAMGGIFFDDGMNTCGPTAGSTQYSDAYQTLKDFVKAHHPGAIVVLNPGNGVPSCYEDAADVLVTFEGSYDSLKNPGTVYQTYPWQLSADPNKFWDIVYGVDQVNLADAMARTRANNAGYVDVTPDVMPNPYDTVPATDYLNAEIANAAAAPPQTAPAVSGLTVVDAYESGMDLAWTSNDWHVVAGYDVSLDGKWFASMTNGYPAATEITIDGLLPGSHHTVSVVARTWSGTVGGAATVSRTLGAAGPKPKAPVASPSTVLPNSVVLTWTEASTGIESYDLYQGGVLQATVPSTPTTARLELLSPGVTYSFTVVARTVDAGVSVPSTAVTVTTPIPAAMVNPGGALSASQLQIHVVYQLAFAVHHAFIDDGSQGTNGYKVVDPQNTAVILMYASYMFEDGILYRHDATKPGEWAWTQVPADGVSLSTNADGTYTWTAPRSDFSSATTVQVVFQGSGGGSPETALAPVPIS